ncbi:MAG: hypothetical protein U0271_19140 [Polyangiaceae bacterium]
MQTLALVSALLAACSSSVEPTGGSGGGGAGSGGAPGTGGQGGSLPPEWSCVGEGFADQASATWTYRLNPITTPEQLTVELCAGADNACANPIPAGLTGPDAAGIVTVEAQPSFDGYLLIQATNLIPTRVILPKAINTPFAQQDIALLSPADFSTVLTAAGLTEQPGRCRVIAVGLGCDGVSARGLTFTATPVDDQFELQYYRGQLPSPGALDTDAQGAALLLDLQPGEITVTGSFGAPPTEFGARSATVVPDTLTYLLIAPSSG